MKDKFTRRADFIDYKKPRIYMITMTTNGRKPLFGTLSYNQEANGDVKAEIRLNPLGKVVNNSIEHITRYYPQISILGKQVMPDHIHFILHIREELPVHLGQVIAGFKAGCNRYYRGMQTTNKTDKENPKNKTSTVGKKENPRSIGLRAVLPPSSLWEQGYHDRILSGQDQLKHMIAYILDNPRRLALKRLNPPFFKNHEITIAGKTYTVIGNDLLLNASKRIQVRCSRSISPLELSTLKQGIIKETDSGAVLVSPFISKGEREIEKEALDRNCTIIKIMNNGFSELFKPTGKYFDLCATGRLLLISPFAYNSKHVHISRAQCEQMNEVANVICL